MSDPSIVQYREFLKDTIRLKIDFSQTDQSRGVAPPPLEKPFSAEAPRIRLVAPDAWEGIGPMDVVSTIKNRRSCRKFTNEPLSLAELSFLLWATQGIRQRVNQSTALRNVPSAGARHALETYLGVLHVEGLEPAIYRYLPLEHEILQEFQMSDLRGQLVEAAFDQSFVGHSAVVFIWTAIPYRMEWRYGLAAHKVLALDAGHVCQNLYLACEAIGVGTCAVAAYHQPLMDRLIRVDGEDEFVVYLAPVGKVS